MIKMVVIDDEEWVCRLIRNLIPADELGISIVGEESNGLDGLKLCRRLKPDIVLTDIRMPGIDGLELTERLYHECPNTKVIIISGYDDFSYAQRALKFGAFDYILKPIDEEELTKVLIRFKNQFHKQSESRQRINKLKSELEKVQQSIVDQSSNIAYKEADGGNADIRKVMAYIDEKYQNDITLDEAAKMVFLNKNYFSEMFKKEAGIGFNEYLNKVRIRKAEKLLTVRNLKINEIGDMVGYRDAAYFIKVFKKYYGMTPSEYRKIKYGPNIGKLEEDR